MTNLERKTLLIHWPAYTPLTAGSFFNSLFRWVCLALRFRLFMLTALLLQSLQNWVLIMTTARNWMYTKLSTVGYYVVPDEWVTPNAKVELSKLNFSAAKNMKTWTCRALQTLNTNHSYFMLDSKCQLRSWILFSIQSLLQHPNPKMILKSLTLLIKSRSHRIV